MFQSADSPSRAEQRWSGARDPAQARRRSRTEMIQDLRTLVGQGLNREQVPRQEEQKASTPRDGVTATCSPEPKDTLLPDPI